jgi:hypothetical protein
MLEVLEKPSLREVIAEVGRRGSGRVSEEGARAALEESHGDAGAPWYVRVLVGVGAWVSAILFAIGAGLSGIADSKVALGVLGLTAFAGGVALRRVAKGEFPVQLALAASMGGRLTFYAAVSDHREGARTFAAALALETLGVFVYPDAVGRFVATLGSCAAAFGLVAELQLPWPSRQLVVLAIGALATALWLREPEILSGRAFGARAAPLQRPVGFGLVVALLFVLLSELPDRGAGWHLSDRFSVTAAGLTALLLWVERDVLRDALASGTKAAGYRLPGDAAEAAHGPAPPEARALVYGGTLAIGVLGQFAPGLVGALLVMALGAHRRSVLLFGLASLFLVFFGSHFYYSLSMSLLAKSGVLLGSGLLMLALRLPLARRASS